MRFMVPSPFSIALAACICFFCSVCGHCGFGNNHERMRLHWQWFPTHRMRKMRRMAIIATMARVIGVMVQRRQRPCYRDRRDMVTNNANSSGSSRFQLVKELYHQVGQVDQVRVVRFYESDESVRGVGLSLFPSSSSLPLLLASTPRHPRCPRDASG